MAFSRVATLRHALLTDVNATQHHTATVETVHPDPSVDNEIARFNGVAGALQGYTSLGPTISDAGVLTLPSGEINFPDVFIDAADVNSLDDYEEGTWTPTIGDSSLDGTGEGQTYSVQVGRYIKVGQLVHIQFLIVMTSIGTLTAGEGCRLLGLPFTTVNIASAEGGIAVGSGTTLSILLGTSVSASVPVNVAHLELFLWDDSGGRTILTVSELTATGRLTGGGTYEAN